MGDPLRQIAFFAAVRAGEIVCWCSCRSRVGRALAKGRSSKRAYARRRAFREGIGLPRTIGNGG
jgi:hypothetical protein